VTQQVQANVQHIRWSRACQAVLLTTTIVFLHYVLYDCMYVDLAVETIISPE
jgi:hypothetical protein